MSRTGVDRCLIFLESTGVAEKKPAKYVCCTPDLVSQRLGLVAVVNPPYESGIVTAQRVSRIRIPNL